MGVVSVNRGLINQMAMCFLMISRSLVLLWMLIEGGLEVKLPTIRRGGKRRWEESEKREDQRRERVRRKKMQMREKVEKSRFTVFPMICGSGRSKSRLAKAAGAEPSGQMRDEKLHVVVVRSNFEVKMYKTPQLRSTFRSWDNEKVHAGVARSTFQSQKC